MTEYRISIRRDFGPKPARHEKAQQVHSILAAFEGVRCLSDRAAPTIIVETTPEVLARVQPSLGEGVWIEAPETKPVSGPSLTL